MAEERDVRRPRDVGLASRDGEHFLSGVYADDVAGGEGGEEGGYLEPGAAAEGEDAVGRGDREELEEALSVSWVPGVVVGGGSSGVHGLGDLVLGFVGGGVEEGVGGHCNCG